MFIDLFVSEVVLSNLFRIIMSKLISPLSIAFVSNKDIHDNILIAHEILSTTKKHKGKGYMTI